jgi:hypothetical protein
MHVSQHIIYTAIGRNITHSESNHFRFVHVPVLQVMAAVGATASGERHETASLYMVVVAICIMGTTVFCYKLNSKH